MSDAIGPVKTRVVERERLLKGVRLTLCRKLFYHRGWR